MPKKIDLTGQKFGRLIALYKNGNTSSGLVLWHCKCECGNECDKVGVELRRGRVKSCGCATREFISNARLKHNEYDLSNEFGIGYTSKGEPFYFDLEDYNKIKDYCWWMTNDGYVSAKIKRSNGKQILMHNIVMGQKHIDHISGVRYDNRKSNLRTFDKEIYSFETYNNINKKVQKNNTSGYPGVSWHSRDNIWEVHISIDNKLHYLGRYTQLEDAIKARKDAEEKYFGEYSYDNSQKLSKKII